MQSDDQLKKLRCLIEARAQLKAVYDLIDTPVNSLIAMDLTSDETLDTLSEMLDDLISRTDIEIAYVADDIAPVEDPYAQGYTQYRVNAYPKGMLDPHANVPNPFCVTQTYALKGEAYAVARDLKAQGLDVTLTEHKVKLSDIPVEKEGE